MFALFRPRSPIVQGMVILVLAGVGAAGCRSGAKQGPLPYHDTGSLSKKQYPSVEEPVADGLAASLAGLAKSPPVTPRPLEVLALTGGVSGAPYSAGVLVGWSESGTRPKFDVVTGISSGALIGAFAFVGPKYDAEMERLVLNLQTSDMLRLPPVRSMLKDGSFGSSKPAERLLQREITACFIDDLRQAHAEGRRLFIGTMNIQTRRLVIWDVGAVACCGRPDADDLVRKILLASFAWPGFVPPVEFNVEVNGRCYREQHYDGGPTSLAFVRFGSTPGWPDAGAPVRPGWLAGSNLYVLANRKLYATPAHVAKRPMPRSVAAVTATFEALGRSDIARLHSFCAVSGMRFHMLAEPQDHPMPPATLGDLYPKQPRPLYEAGYRMGAGRPTWRTTPPGAEPGEESVPRDSLQLVADEVIVAPSKIAR